MPTDLFVDYMPGQLDIKLNTSVSTAPSSGTIETWSVIVPLGLNLVVPGSVVGQYRGFIESEIVYWTAGAITNGVQPWTVKRAMEGTVAAFHAAGAILLLDATAGSLANMVQLSPSAPQSGGITVTGELVGTDFAPAAATGATATARYFRATASGTPATGTWALGDIVPDQTGKIWMCTVAGTPGTWTNIAPTTGFVNPMTTTQDVIVGGASGAPTRLGVGANATVLTVTGGVVGWATPVAGFTNPMTTAGDLILGGSGGAAGRLAKGSDGYILTIDPTTHLPVWAINTSNPMTTLGDMIIGSAAGVGTRLAIGSAGQVLTVPTTPTPGVDLALSKTVSAGGGTDGFGFRDSNGPNIVDGSDGTGARVGQGFLGDYAQVDLGAAQAIATVRVYCSGPVVLNLSASTDGTTFTAIASDLPATADQTVATGTTTPYRYWRLTERDTIAGQWTLNSLECHAAVVQPVWQTPSIPSGTPAAELGYAQLTSSQTGISATSYTDVTGLSLTVTVGSRAIIVEFTALQVDCLASTGSQGNVQIFDVTASAQVMLGTVPGQGSHMCLKVRLNPSAGSRTFKVQAKGDGSNTARVLASASAPAGLRVYEV